jgi:aminoglycoside phosphotransferase (APT) family kinase protein
MPLRLSEQFVLPGFGHRLADVGMHEFLRSERSDSRSLDERQAAVRRRESASGAHLRERYAELSGRATHSGAGCLRWSGPYPLA